MLFNKEHVENNRPILHALSMKDSVTIYDWEDDKAKAKKHAECGKAYKVAATIMLGSYKTELKDIIISDNAAKQIIAIIEEAALSQIGEAFRGALQSFNERMIVQQNNVALGSDPSQIDTTNMDENK